MNVGTTKIKQKQKPIKNVVCICEQMKIRPVHECNQKNNTQEKEAEYP